MSSERLSSFGGSIRFCPQLALGHGSERGSAQLRVRVCVWGISLWAVRVLAVTCTNGS